jgi:dTDP-4-dehydrorhamnose reductase
MNILLFGKNGQLGWELQRSLAPLGELVALERRQADLERPAGVTAALEHHRPAVIVNAAAYTAVDQAETEIERARRINATAPAAMARWAAEHHAWLVHYSTDYVFDGHKPDPYVEDDATGPLGAYGQTKLEGEQAIRATGCRHLILRTSWVFGTHGQNFVRTMLRLVRERDALRVVADQVGAPTGSALLADVTALMLYRLACDPALAAIASGTYHVTAKSATSWHGLACHVIQTARDAGQTLRIRPEAIAPIPSQAYPTPARRPKNSRLDTNKLERTFGLRLPHWEGEVTRVVREMLAQGS